MATHNVPEFKSLGEFLAYHHANKETDHWRLGQRFVNLYIKHPWPELFYCIVDQTSTIMIMDWLTRHQYDNGTFPRQLATGRL